MEATDLLQRQDSLQAEASRVLDDLDLLALLGRVGQPMPVGSFVLGLMVWRDIDIHVYCDPLSADDAFEALRPLASHPASPSCASRIGTDRSQSPTSRMDTIGAFGMARGRTTNGNWMSGFCRSVRRGASTRWPR